MDKEDQRERVETSDDSTSRDDDSLPDDFDADDFAQVDYDVSLTDEEMQKLTNGDPELIKKVKYIQLEHAVIREEGGQVPSKLKFKYWQEIINLDSRSKRRKFFSYLFKTEMKDLNARRKKEEKNALRRKEFEERPMPSREEDPYGMFYALTRNTLFLRLYDTTVNKFFHNRACSAMLHNPPIVLDCSYDENMNFREAKNCAKQLELLITENKQHPEPFNLYLCNADRHSKMMTYLRRSVPTLDDDSFPINIHEESFMDVLPRERLVYLTPHTRDDLDEYNEDDIYIIGAMVDKTDPRPFSLGKAKKLGLRMRRLPIDKYLMWGLGGKSLTVNQMGRIMLDIRYSRGDWKTAFRHVPMRKLNRDFHPYPDQIQNEGERNEGNAPVFPQRKERKSLVLEDYELLNRRKGFRRSEMYTPSHNRPQAPKMRTTKQPLVITMSGDGNSAKRRCLEYDPDMVNSTAITEIEQETFAFVWKLEDYSTLRELQVITSPEFRGGPKSKHTWLMYTHPKFNSNGVEYMTLYLKLVEWGDASFWFPSRNNFTRKIKARFEFSILDKNDRPSMKLTGSVNDYYKSSAWGKDKFIPSSELVSPTRQLVYNNTLKIHCKVSIIGELKHVVKPTSSQLFVSKSPEDEKRSKERNVRRANDFGTLLKNPIFTDCTVLTESKRFEVHKNILAACSSVFKEMFKANNSLMVPGFDEDVVKGMLEYIYTGETACMGERAPDLLQIADKYDIAGLKEEAELIIADSLSVANAASVLLVAHTSNAAYLKSQTISFINSNKGEVMKTKAFQDIEAAPTNAGLFRELYRSNN
ncbi:Mitochondrial ribonuclease P protein 1 [Orchesella cincta]|uniref:RNA (guanine-9-)-methyltransferase domain-containing protein 1 n=1 Tax=Orchesella cincta TaxID=48709 RepID=A0A1D2MBX1_ORCCI|nr:Mitochondrial ribonuclease P protein 1 [Orchesella cincta]